MKKVFLIALLSSILITSCGKKGKLYLPDEDLKTEEISLPNDKK